jgi:hypothetical protein
MVHSVAAIKPGASISLKGTGAFACNEKARREPGLIS